MGAIESIGGALATVGTGAIAVAGGGISVPATVVGIGILSKSIMGFYHDYKDINHMEKVEIVNKKMLVSTRVSSAMATVLGEDRNKILSSGDGIDMKDQLEVLMGIYNRGQVNVRG